MIKSDSMEPKQVLIIDDDNRNIFALSAVLKAKGYSVHAATNAVQGLELLRGNRGIKLVLLDIMMPDMDGYEALARIRGEEALARLPVFAVTAKAMVGDREKALQAGADEYISKPIDIDELLALMQRY